jgi:hypothetical protein
MESAMTATFVLMFAYGAPDDTTSSGPTNGALAAVAWNDENGTARVNVSSGGGDDQDSADSAALNTCANNSGQKLSDCESFLERRLRLHHNWHLWDSSLWGASATPSGAIRQCSERGPYCKPPIGFCTIAPTMSGR